MSFKGIFSKNNFITMTIAVIAAVVLSGGSFFALKMTTKKKANRLITEYKKSSKYQTSTLFTPYKGSDNPKIEIISYGSFFCGHCIHFSKVVDQVLKMPKYAKVLRYYAKSFVSKRACSGGYPTCTISLLSFEMMKNGLYWEFEKRWKFSHSNPSLEKGIKIAKELLNKEINLDEIKKNNFKYAKIIMSEVEALGVNATPTWFVNGRKIVGSVSMKVFIEFLEFLLKEKK